MVYACMSSHSVLLNYYTDNENQRASSFGGIKVMKGISTCRQDLLVVIAKLWPYSKQIGGHSYLVALDGTDELVAAATP